MSVAPFPPEPPAEADGVDETALADLLAALEAELRAARGPGGDEDLLDADVLAAALEGRLLGRPDLGAALAEVGGDLAALEGQRLEPLGAHLLAAVRGALEIEAAASHAARPAGPVLAGGDAAAGAARAGRRLLPAARTSYGGRVRGLLRAAALLVVGLGVLLLSVGGQDAEAGVRILAFDHVEVARGARRVAPGRIAPVGTTFSAVRGELVGLRLDTGATAVLAEGDVLGVRRLGDEGLLALEEGEVRLLVGAEGELRLALAEGVRLHLEHGRAHVVARGPDGRPLLALEDGGIASVLVPGRAPERRAGPATYVLGRDGVVLAGRPAATLFCDLEFFGGALTVLPRALPVSASLWRLVRGRGVRAGRALVVDPGIRGEEVAVLGWTPSSRVAAAALLRVAISAPHALTLRLPALGVEARLDPGDGVQEPGVDAVDLPLPDGWYTLLGDRELLLELGWPPTDGDVVPRTVRVDGVSFLLDTPPASTGGAPER